MTKSDFSNVLARRKEHLSLRLTCAVLHSSIMSLLVSQCNIIKFQLTLNQSMY